MINYGYKLWKKLQQFEDLKIFYRKMPAASGKLNLLPARFLTLLVFRKSVLLLWKKQNFSNGVSGKQRILSKRKCTRFADRDNEFLTLRPEATASVIRAYIEHNMSAAEQITKLFTIGPMFRRERPQKGRFRQFNQIDVELFGEDKPQSDAEIIFMLMHFLTSAGLKDLQLEINSLGCASCRPVFSQPLLIF
jgi:histidyl-tRNA synthetase